MKGICNEVYNDEYIDEGEKRNLQNSGSTQILFFH